MISSVPPHLIQDLESKLQGSVEQDASLSGFTTFRVGGKAEVLVRAESEDDLSAVARAVGSSEVPIHILGRGSNVLISDHGLEGVVIRLKGGFDWIRDEDTTISAGGLTSFPKVANKAWRLGLSGLEFCVAIPATVGGAVKMNAGAHGSSVSDVLGSARIFRFASADVVEMDREDLDMRYRQTSLGATDIVCSAMFQLTAGDRDEIAGRMAGYRQHRTDTQPVDLPNAGSTFRNPEGATAGELIEASGLKGLRVGGAHVSEKHANFFVADNGAKAQDVYDLIVRVQEAVLRDHGVTLVPEVHPMGRFDSSPFLDR